MQVFALLLLFGLQTHQNQQCVTLCQCPLREYFISSVSQIRSQGLKDQ
jgi:hypothetical protein